MHSSLKAWPAESNLPKKLDTLLDLCVSSLRRGHANLLCIVPILTDDPRRESNRMMFYLGCYAKSISYQAEQKKEGHLQGLWGYRAKGFVFKLTDVLLTAGHRRKLPRCFIPGEGHPSCGQLVN